MPSLRWFDPKKNDPDLRGQQGGPWFAIAMSLLGVIVGFTLKHFILQ